VFVDLEIPSLGSSLKMEPGGFFGSGLNPSPLLIALFIDSIAKSSKLSKVINKLNLI
jgi:hypothetical protein